MPQTSHIERHFTGTAPVRSALQTVLIDGPAAAAFAIARVIA